MDDIVAYKLTFSLGGTLRLRCASMAKELLIGSRVQQDGVDHLDDLRFVGKMRLTLLHRVDIIASLLSAAEKDVWKKSFVQYS